MRLPTAANAELPFDLIADLVLDVGETLPGDQVEQPHRQYDVRSHISGTPNQHREEDEGQSSLRPAELSSGLQADDADSLSSSMEASSGSNNSADVTKTTTKQRTRRRRTDDERREQNRLTVQRFYYRKKRTIDTLREEETKLDDEFKKLRQLVRETTVESQQSEFTQLVLLRETLQLQNELLQRLVRSQSKKFADFGRTFRIKLQQLDTSASTTPTTSNNFEFLPHISKEECEERIQSSLELIRDSQETSPSASSSQGSTLFEVCDWSCQVVDSELSSPPSSSSSSSSSSPTGNEKASRFLFTKRLVENTGPSALAQRTIAMWTDHNSSELHAQLFPNNMASSLRVLQQVDETTWIVLQTIDIDRKPQFDDGVGSPPYSPPPPPEWFPTSTSDGITSPHNQETAQRLQTILQISLVPISDDPSTKHIVLIQSIPHEHFELQDPVNDRIQPEWIDVFYWCSIAEGSSSNSGVGPAVVTWGGEIPSRSLASSGFSMTAFEHLIYELTRVVRWETLVSN